MFLVKPLTVPLLKSKCHTGVAGNGAITKSQNSSLKRGLNTDKQDMKTGVIRTPFVDVIDARYNKGLSFTMEERQRLKVNGLFPCAHRNSEMQLYTILSNFRSMPTNIARYRYIMSIRQRHQRLYYRFLTTHVNEALPIVYTPTVGQACQLFGLTFLNPMGIYITKYDRKHMKDVLQNWPEKDIRAICATDGGRILGLGDLGAHGMGIPVGKLDLYTALAGVNPRQLLPIVLDVGTNNKQLLADPLYIGAREKRMVGPEYEEFVQEFMEAVVELYGSRTLIHFEDFATPNAFLFLKKYQRCFCYFNDDIQGTGAMGLAGCLAVVRVTKKALKDHVIMFAGAGSASVGIAKTILSELKKDGLSETEACQKISMIDDKGLVTKNRTNLSPDVTPFAKDMEPLKNLADAVEKLKPSILMGATGVGGLFTEQVIRAMAKNNERPAIFALSNPTSNAECTAEQAYKFTDGRVIFSAGSPFPPVSMNGKRFTPGQSNNCFSFPGICFGALCARPKYMPDEVYLVTAHTLANYTSEELLAAGSLFPLINEAPDVALEIAINVVDYLVSAGLSTLDPLPKNVCEYVRSQLYDTSDQPSLPSTWTYPKFPEVPIPKVPPAEEPKAKCSR